MTCIAARELLGAYFDNELDLVNSLEVERHLRDCAACAGALERQQALRSAIRGQAPYYSTPPELRRRLRAVRGESRLRWLSPQWGLAVAAMLALAVLAWKIAPRSGPGLEQEVVAAHVRSLQANHLMDVPSTDRHTVKPWFAGKLDFAPEVPDLSGKGFTMEGGRLDYLEGRPVAALVYKRRLHTINVFTWPASGEQPLKADTRQGFHIAHWKRGGMEWWAVSDLAADELAEMARQGR